MGDRGAMKCPGDERLTSMLDGELDANEKARIEAHLACCEDCFRRHRALQAIDGLLAVPEEPVPVGALARVRAIPETVPPSAGRAGALRRTTLGLAAAAAVVLLLFPLFRERPSSSGIPPAPEPAPEVPGTRARILTALANPGVRGGKLVEEYGESTLVVLHRIAAGDRPAAARAALRCLGDLGRRESLPTLLAAAERPDRRREAVRALGALGDARALRVLARLFLAGDEDDVVLPAIERIGGEEAARLIARRLATEEEPRARELIGPLARVDGKVAAEALLDLMERPTFRPAVHEAFSANRDRLLPHLVAVARGWEEERAHAALGVLASLGEPEVLPALAELLDDRVRRGAAARALARLDTPEAGAALLTHYRFPEVRRGFEAAGPGIEAWLIRRLETGDTGMRRRAVALLGLCGGREAAIALLSAAKDRALTPDVVDSLAAIGGEWGVSALAILAEEDHRLGRPVVAALGRTGEAVAVEPLVEIGLGDRSLRDLCVSALSRIPTEAAVQGVLALDPGRRASPKTIRTLSVMDRELVVAALNAMLGGERDPTARRALAALGAGTARDSAGWTSIY